MDINKMITDAVSNNLDVSVISISHIGKGASGSVYCVECNGKPDKIAVKISDHPDLISKEAEMLSFLKEKTDSKIPEVYFFCKVGSQGILAMEFIGGVTPSQKNLWYKSGKKHLAESIIDNLLVIQKAHNDKFGPYDNAVYDTWYDYYKEFAKEIYDFSVLMNSQGKLDSTVMKAVEVSYRNLNKILAADTGKPTLIHGDYWLPNFIIDKDSMELLAAVDPFNVMWAEPEYELFAMTVGYGKSLHLYEIYKSKANVSKFCDLKLEMYALYSELLWYKKLGTITHSYLKMRSKRLLKEMKKHHLDV